MKEFVKVYQATPEREDEVLLWKAPTNEIKAAIPGALRIYDALKKFATDLGLQGFTLRCFDLLSLVRNTGCVALAKLNSEGFIAGCEGDVPTMLSMAIGQALVGVSGFQSNPARINPETGEIVMAHCTIPLNMVSSFDLDTHFESGIGVGIKGYMKEGDVTLFKISGNLNRHFAEEGKLMRHLAEGDLCRTQQVILLNHPEKAQYFLANPIGNHHVVFPGRCKQLLDAFMDS